MCLLDRLSDVRARQSSLSLSLPNPFVLVLCGSTFHSRSVHPITTPRAVVRRLSKCIRTCVRQHASGSGCCWDVGIGGSCVFVARSCCGLLVVEVVWWGLMQGVVMKSINHQSNGSAALCVCFFCGAAAIRATHAAWILIRFEKGAARQPQVPCWIGCPQSMHRSIDGVCCKRASELGYGGF